MLGKRRRDSTDCDSDPSTQLPLTKRNLIKLQRTMGRPPSVPKTPSKRALLDAPKTPSRTPSKRSSKAGSGSVGEGLDADVSTTGRSTAPCVLDTWRMFARRKHAMPPGLKDLVDQVSKPRFGEYTPKTKRVVHINDTTRVMKEDDAIHILEDDLGFRGEAQTEGEKHIHGGHNHQWRIHAMPRPTAKPDPDVDAALQAAMVAVGAPSKPKPDIAYSYTTSTFSQTEMDGIHSLSLIEQVQTDPPWFPFLLYEWKSSRGGGTEDAALLQAGRDGATAVNALYNFLTACGFTSPPTEWTTVFSVCITSSTAEIFIHWRRIAEDGEITWEADSIDCGFLSKDRDVFALRSILLQILDWARGTRLETLQSALAQRRGYQAEAAERRRYGEIQKPNAPATVNQSLENTTEVRLAADVDESRAPLSPPFTTSSVGTGPSYKRKRADSPGVLT